MNKKQYNNVIESTLKHEQTDDSLSTARAIFDNMGVALPQGDIKTVYETIKTNNYMGWKSCSMQEAQAAADKGVAAIGISEDKIVVISAKDEEQPVAQTASVMTLDENTSAFAVEGMQYYSYSYGGTTTTVFLSQELKHFISVIAGEAIGANTKTWKAVAHTIMNRLKEPRDVWSNVTCLNDVLIKSQYKAVDEPQYNACMTYLDNRDCSNKSYEELIQAVIPIYLRCEADFTGGAHYIFNIYGSAALLADLESKPNRYVKCGPFAGISDTEFRMYRCLW